ncbi:MAG: hypothetical protein Kow00108_07150 [Calditrichia bacterium]
MKKIYLFFLLLLFVGIGSSQVYVEEPSYQYENDEYGFHVAMAQQGFGLGGFYMKLISPGNYIGFNGAFYKIRDNKEFQFYYYGYTVVRNKINNLFIIPLLVSYKKYFSTGIFANDLRPNFYMSAGTILGMNFPNKDNLPPDTDPDVIRQLDNEFELGASWGIGLAMDISTGKNLFLTIRPQYQWVVFRNSIAQQKWHNYYELRFEFGVRK